MNALGHAWHADHFVCVVCRSPFPDMEYYAKDGHPYCEKDFKQQFCPKCVYLAVWHCVDLCIFVYVCVRMPLFAMIVVSVWFALMNVARRCPVCSDYIVDGGLEACGRWYHSDHLRCSRCTTKLELEVSGGRVQPWV